MAVTDFQALAREMFGLQMRLFRCGGHRPFEDLSRGELFILGYLSLHGGTAAPCQLSAARGVSSARVAALLNQLEHKGYATRRKHPEDRRRIQALITPAGEECAARHRREALERLEQILRFLGEEDAQAYLRIQRRVLEHHITTGETTC